MTCTDIHNHILPGVDDGAADAETSRRILQAAYAEGVRELCFTPHYHPGIFGDNTEKTEAAFREARMYAERELPGLQVFLGSEVRYHENCIRWLKDDACRTLNGSCYLLVDFLEQEAAETIMAAMSKLLNAGYVPVLAHAERYAAFHRDLRELRELRNRGTVIQMDAASPFGGWGSGARSRSRKMLREGLVDVVASDAHNLDDRPMALAPCYEAVLTRFGQEYAELIFDRNPSAILADRDIIR